MLTTLTTVPWPYKDKSSVNVLPSFWTTQWYDFRSDPSTIWHPSSHPCTTLRNGGLPVPFAAASPSIIHRNSLVINLSMSSVLSPATSEYTTIQGTQKRDPQDKRPECFVQEAHPSV